jgi:uncharacterized delta-60 repeat protein
MRSSLAGPGAPLVALAFAIACASLRAAPGDLDPAFGSGGIVIDPMSGNDARAHALAIDPSGRIVVAGESVVAGAADFAVLRLAADGNPDPAFAGGGRVYAGFGVNSLDEGYGVAALADGRIVVGGTTFVSDGSGNYPDFAALRLTVDGGVDAAFGNHGNGWATSARAGGDSGIAMTSTAGGFALAGYVSAGGGNDAAALRLDTLGMPLPLFGDAGVVVAQPDTNTAFAIALAAGGATLLGGQFDSGGTFVLRVDADGVPDPAFAGDGRAELGALLDRIEDLLVLADGRVLVAGSAQIGADAHAAIVRLAADGVPDASFGSGGRLAVPAASIGMNTLRLTALAQQVDGRLVAAGRAQGGGALRALVLRATPDGVLDASFASGGLCLIDAGGGTQALDALALQPDGAIVVAGQHRAASAEDQFFVARLQGGNGGALPNVSIADASLVEGDAGSNLVSFTVSLSAPSDGSVTVDVATDVGPATPGMDYQPTTASLAFPVGASAALFQVPVFGDTDAEPDETFLVRLSNPVGAVVGNATATGIIIDDDAGVPPSAAQPAPAAGVPALLLLVVLLMLVAMSQRRRTG